MDLRRHGLVIGIRRPLLGADGGQRPRGGVLAGAVRDPGAGLPALQLHGVEPLRDRHGPGHAEGAKYVATRRSRNPQPAVAETHLFSDLC